MNAKRMVLDAMIAVCTSVAAFFAMGGAPTSATTPDDDDPWMTGKMVIYADFLGQPLETSRGLYEIDVSKAAWSKVATLPVQNGVVSLSYLRLSPDKRSVVYSEYQSRRDRSIAYPALVWSRGLGTSDLPRNLGRIGGRPTWSPDGKQLLLSAASVATGPAWVELFETWIVNADGSNPSRLPIIASDDVWDWSGDGSWLAAVAPASRDGINSNIVIMRPNGSGRVVLTNQGISTSPRFSPDGKRVAYLSAGREGQALWVTDLGGTDRRKIYAVKGDAIIGRATWSPDGRYLAAVVSPRNGNGGASGGGDVATPRLCTIDTRDGNCRFVSHPPARVLGDPDWR